MTHDDVVGHIPQREPLTVSGASDFTGLPETMMSSCPANSPRQKKFNLEGLVRNWGCGCRVDGWMGGAKKITNKLNEPTTMSWGLLGICFCLAKVK